MRSTTPVIVAVATLACFVVAGVVIIAVAVPEGGNPGSLIALLIGVLAPTISSLVVVAQLSQVRGQVTRVGGQVNDLANGLMDSKIRAGVADVIADPHLDPEAQQLLDHDRQRIRAAHPTAHPNNPTPTNTEDRA